MPGDTAPEGDQPHHAANRVDARVRRRGSAAPHVDFDIAIEPGKGGLMKRPLLLGSICLLVLLALSGVQPARAEIVMPQSGVDRRMLTGPDAPVRAPSH
jgi:hypothetical protein